MASKTKANAKPKKKDVKNAEAKALSRAVRKATPEAKAAATKHMERAHKKLHKILAGPSPEGAKAKPPKKPKTKYYDGDMRKDPQPPHFDGKPAAAPKKKFATETDNALHDKVSAMGRKTRHKWAADNFEKHTLVATHHASKKHLKHIIKTEKAKPDLHQRGSLIKVAEKRLKEETMIEMIIGKYLVD